MFLDHFCKYSPVLMLPLDHCSVRNEVYTDPKMHKNSIPGMGSLAVCRFKFIESLRKVL